jgi:hypothetical protein
MGLFDFFKKKTGSSQANVISPENRLEASLRKSAGEPSLQSAFYGLLLAENLFVLTVKTAIPAGNQVLETDTAVNILKLDDGTIPVFSSTDRIFDRGVIKEEVQYLAMKGEDLFNLAKGAGFVLNPYSDYGKRLLPAEVANLLNGTHTSTGHQLITLEKETPVQVGQPSKYPAEIIDALKQLFATTPSVKAAYLGWIFDPGARQPPHYIFGLHMDGPDPGITREAGFTARRFLPQQDIVDFMQLDNNGGISDYFFRQTTPFYTRQNVAAT